MQIDRAARDGEGGYPQTIRIGTSGNNTLNGTNGSVTS
jgi:hypothetical protein